MQASAARLMDEEVHGVHGKAQRAGTWWKRGQSSCMEHGLEVGANEKVGFVPWLETFPSSYLLFAQMTLGSSCHGGHLILAKISP